MRDVLDEWRPAIEAAIEEVLPRSIDEAYLSDYFGDPSYTYDVEAIQDGLSTPVWELLDRGGKRWRAVLFLVMVEAFGEDPEEFLPYATIPEILHTGTIIVDDVEDNAELRRGGPALHTVYGEDVVLNAGNALYFIPLKVIDNNTVGISTGRRLEAYEMLTYELNRTHLGQGMDIDWHNRRRVDVTVDEYLEMSACKTGCLARIVGRLAAIVTDQPEAVQRTVTTYMERMSIGFQIVDDVLDIENSLGRAGEFGKAFGNDIREGKITLMVIHAIDEAEPGRAARLEDILSTAEPTDEEVIEAIEILEETDAIEYGRSVAEDLAAEAQAAISSLDLDPEPAAALEAFPRFMIDRDR